MDPKYLRWLEIYHPDRVPADRHTLVLAPESSAGVSEDNPSLADVFFCVCSHHLHSLRLNWLHPLTLFLLSILP